MKYERSLALPHLSHYVDNLNQSNFVKKLARNSSKLTLLTFM